MDTFYCYLVYLHSRVNSFFNPRPAAYLQNRVGGGQELGGRHFTQGGRPEVVIGGTFRRNFSSLEGV